MGLTSDFSKFGVTFEDAYHRIGSLNYNVHEYEAPVVVSTGSIDENGEPVPPVYETQWTKTANASGEVLTYTSLEARSAHSESLSRTHFSFQVDLDSDSTWIEQAYAYLKTTPDFSAATDAL